MDSRYKMSGMTQMGGCPISDVEHDLPLLRHPRRWSAGIHPQNLLNPYASRLTAPLQENTLLRIDVLLSDACLLCLLSAVDIN